MASPPPFPEKTVENRFKSFARGMCECQACPMHEGHCKRMLDSKKRGPADDNTAWEAHHFDLNGDASIENCRIFCVPCLIHQPGWGTHRQPG